MLGLHKNDELIGQKSSFCIFCTLVLNMLTSSCLLTMGLLLYGWNFINIFIGGFPFMLTYRNNLIHVLPTFFWMPFAVLGLFVCYRNVKHVCPLYNFPSGEPPMYECYSFWYSCIFVILHRFWLYKPTSRLFQSIVLSESVRKYLIISLSIFLYLVIVGVTKFLTFLYSYPISFPVMMLINISASYIWLAQPCLIIFQFIMVCYFLDEEITNLKIELTKELTIKHIVTLQEKLSCSFKRFKNLLDVYIVDVFIAMTFSSLGACVNLHSFINISTNFIWVPTLSFKAFLLKFLFYVGNITGMLSFVCWLIFSAASLKSKASTVINEYRTSSLMELTIRV